ncbi:MAG: ABC transporter ATP-binding protein [Clostridia bacterium]|nr:ABC transporter ATP-binding protein [Clostridia bacterium]
MSKPAIEVKNMSMMFNLNSEKVDNLKEYFIKLLKRQIHFTEFWALKDINLTVEKGDRVGILGFNGAGKSTLLKVIAGVLKPTEGTVSVSGVVAPMLELGAGFDSNYSGKENIYLYGATMGYSRKFIEKKFDEIVEFSELQNFMNVPVKNYSSGMRARLGFAIASAVEPDILILDEVLSVGDAKFRKKSEAKIMSMFDKGVTVLFVSHSVDQVLKICNKAIILDHGKIIASGGAEEICEEYNKMVSGGK